jgi:hypothetical protein
MKDLKHIQSFNEHQKNLNISDVSESKKLDKSLSNVEFDNLIEKLSKMNVSSDDIQKFKEYSIEFENEDDEYEKKAILDTFSLDISMDYEDIYDDVEDDISDLYYETGLDPMEF